MLSHERSPMENYFDKFPDTYAENSRRLLQTPSAFARSALFYVQETGYLKLKKSHIARRKNLDSFLIALVLSGSGSLVCDGKFFPLEKGACFFVNCRTPYHHQSSDSNPWELLWVHFNGATSQEYYQFFASLSLPAFRPQAFPELQKKLESLLDVNLYSDLSAEIDSSRLIVDILSIILQDITSAEEEKHPSHAKMTEVRGYLDAHYAEKLSLDDLSQRFFISKYHLSREFHKAFGVGLNQYVSARRITQAKKLLRFSDCSLEEIARLCGFYDASYLNKQFRKSEGLGASEFRRKWRA